jgi:chromosomal replication initiator protein
MTIQEIEDVRLERSLAEIWAQTQTVLEKKLSHATIKSWIQPTKLLEIVGDEATIGVLNEFCKSWILSKYLDVIAEALSLVLKRRMTTRLVVDASMQQETYTASLASITVVPDHVPVFDSRPAVGFDPGTAGRSAAQRAESPQGRITSANLNPKYTFETFVVGSHNRFSHSAAMAVADRPGQAYNPLFIYGGVGLGKTHIMQAIGHHILQHSPSTLVRYISCERFTNELINSIRDDRMVEFRKRYRQVDVLLMDDIQFIEGKESTQEEFFHTFNALRDSGRQIVISSDRPPKALSLLEERLRSRFEWGLIADIQTPDLETRTAILRKKSDHDNMRVPDEVLEYIASVVTTNIRELEGALIRTHAIASLTGAPLTLKTAISVLQPAGSTQQKAQLTVEKVIEAVAAFYRVEPSELKCAKRSHDLALPRHVAMYLAHDLMQMSFPRIGDAFGGRKHTSTLYAYEKVKSQMPKDPELASAIAQITRHLGS